MCRRSAGRRGVALLQRALFLPVLGRALRPWNDGTWYDAPQDFNVAVPICKMGAEAEQPWCPSKWHYFNGSCWIALDRECEWRGAVELCKEAGARYEPHHAELASVTSAQENDVVRGICGERMCWLGLREKRGLEDAYEWADGIPITYWNWHKGEPSNWRGLDENVVVMNFGWKQFKQLEKKGGWADGDWYDISGGFNKPVPLCERPADFEKTKSANCADGWEENRGRCYQLLEWNCTHAEATAACMKQGAHLVAIDNEEEQLFVKSLCGPRMCWLGMYQEVGSKAWKWVDNSSMVFANWARGEPNNVGGRENRAMMNLDLGWVHGKNHRWRNPQHKKARAAFQNDLLFVEEHLTTKIRLGAMALFAVAYMTVYIVRLALGVRVPGGPLAAVSAALVVVFGGGVLDFFLWTHAGLAMGFLLAVGAAEGLYIGGTHTGLFKPLGRPAAESARSPAMAGVLE